MQAILFSSIENLEHQSTAISTYSRDTCDNCLRVLFYTCGNIFIEILQVNFHKYVRYIKYIIIV